jgi:DNA polymerase III epsilon subunit-like protein
VVAVTRKAEDFWYREPIVVVDFETTGMNPYVDVPVSAAYVRFEYGLPVDSGMTYINPLMSIPRASSKVHGVYKCHVKDSPPPILAMRRLLADQEPAWFCGYGALRFDRVLLDRFWPHPRTDIWGWVDPLVWVRHVDKFVRGPGRHTLSKTCERWGVELEEAHNPLADCRATGQLLLNHLRKRIPGDVSMDALLEQQTELAAEQERDYRAWKSKQKNE